ncbi:RNA pyrophosphohydrolase [Candidatus Deianiraea vastatrix]|uniref:RNA pyrophosphohydrolase n=1 Tax=Candidatus Deianiraea vastatrix TaxID=2163644 RepID=A0A5B8XFQ6_9RICK|nr:RNA pyrophosphohydrolase [Candidatus Deianiraea vastatrix]QED23111.1 RNA pyrophosphohydrolase [Candidatus Deianiraea vastatrix]
MKVSHIIDLDFDEKIVSKDGKYRIGVGAVIEKNGLVFCAKRMDNKSTIHYDTLQMPQGGLDSGEDLKTAIYREVFEETGIKKDKLEFISRLDDWIYYDLPLDFQKRIGGKGGQAHIWYHFKFTGENTDVDLNNGTHMAEFSNFYWKKGNEIVERSIHFKKDLHEKVLRAFGFL